MSSTQPHKEFEDNSWLLFLGLLLIVVVVSCYGIMLFRAFNSEEAEAVSVSSSSSSAQADVSGHYFVTEWGSHFLVNKEKVDQISADLNSCLKNVALDCENCYGQEERKVMELVEAMIDCDNEYYNRIRIRQEPPTFYSYPQNEGDPYEEFWMCTHGLVSPLHDYWGADADDVQTAVLECLKYYPEPHGSAA